MIVGENYDVLRLNGGDLVGFRAYYHLLVIILARGFGFSSWCMGIGLGRMSSGFSVAGIFLRVLIPSCTSSRTWWTSSHMSLVRFNFSAVVTRELAVDLSRNILLGGYVAVEL